MLALYLSLLNTNEEKTLFEELYYEHRGIMFRIANGILKDTQRSEDAVNEAFLSLAKNMNKISGRSCNQIRSYLIIIVRNAALQMYNKHKKELCTDDDLEAIPDITDIELGAEQKESNETIFRLIKQLDPKYADVMMLCYGYDIPVPEIAEILGISYENVKVRLMRGRNMLREQLLKERENDRNSV